MHEILTAGSIITMAGAVLLLTYVAMQRPSMEQKTMQMATISILLVVTGHMGEIMTDVQEVAVYSVCIKFTGYEFIMMMGALFTGCYFNRRMDERLAVVIIGAKLCLLIPLYLFRHMPFYFSSYEYVTDGIYPRMILHTGILANLDTIFNLWLAVGLLLTLYYIKRASIKRKQAHAILKMTAFPNFIYFLYVSGLTAGYDLTPYALIITEIEIYRFCRRFSLANMVEISQECVADNATDGYVVTDLNRQFVYASLQACRLFPELKEYDSRKTMWEIERRFFISDHQLRICGRNYELRRKEVFDKSEICGYAYCFFDITENHNQLQRLMELKKEADQASQAKSDFLANMSHEIRTPMNAIVGMTELILRENVSSEVKTNITNVRNAAKSLLTIINDILDFSKLESRKMELVNVPYQIASLLNDVISITKVRLEDRPIELKVEVDQTIPEVLYGDETRFRQILINLLNNAVKYTNEGFVELKVSWKRMQRMALLTVSVKDTGIGISEENKKQLFKSFQRVDTRKNRSIEGTGLGLSITKSLLELMNGEIYVESQYGEGSTFTIEFPQAIQDDRPCQYEYCKAVRLKEEGAFRTTFRARKAAVLVVDDNPVNLSVATGLMKPYGMTVHTASGGRECLNRMETNRYDLILLDYMMPDMDGVDTLKAIRRRTSLYFQSVPVIALTADAVSGAKGRFLESGFSDYISKPIDLKKLDQKLLEFIPEEKIDGVKEEGIQWEEAEDAPSAEWDMPGINVQEGLEHAGGDAILYHQILEITCQDGKEMIKELRQDFEQKDWKKYVIHAHSLKSVTANIGAMEISALAKAQEFAGKEGNISYLEAHAGEMMEGYEELLTVIQRHLERESSSENVVDRAELAATEEWLEQEAYQDIIGNLICALEDFDLNQAENILQGLKEFAIPSAVRKHLTEAEDMLEQIDYEEAVRILKRTLEMDYDRKE